MATCPNCGAEVGPADAYCAACGHRVGTGDGSGGGTATPADGADRGAGSATEVVSLRDPDGVGEPPDLPDLDLACSVTLAADELGGVLSDLEARGVESVRLTARPDESRVDAGGADGNVRFEIEGSVECTGTAPVASLYALDRLRALVDAIPRGARLRVEVGESYPLVLRHAFAGGDGRVEYGIAPRVRT